MVERARAACRFGPVSGPPTDPASWAGLDELTAELGWECPHCGGTLCLDVRPVDVAPEEGLVNVIEAWCEVCDVRWFAPRELHLYERGGPRGPVEGT